MAAHRRAQRITSPYSDRIRVGRGAGRPGRAGPATAQQRGAGLIAPLAHKPTQARLFSVVTMPDRPPGARHTAARAPGWGSGSFERPPRAASRVLATFEHIWSLEIPISFRFGRGPFGPRQTPLTPRLEAHRA